MKAGVLLFYILLNFLYLCFGSGRLWGGIHHIAQYVLIFSFAFWQVRKERLNKFERLLLQYLMFFEFCQSIFTGACIGAAKNWVIAYCFVFTDFMGIVFVAMLAYGWFKNRYELGKY